MKEDESADKLHKVIKTEVVVSKKVLAWIITRRKSWHLLCIVIPNAALPLWLLIDDASHNGMRSSHSCSVAVFALPMRLVVVMLSAAHCSSGCNYGSQN